MNLFLDAIAWIFAPEQWQGGSSSIPVLAGQQLYYTVISVAIAALIAVPLGWWIGHTGKGRNAAIAIAGAARAIPAFGLLTLLVLVFGVLFVPHAAVLCFVLLGIPSILAGAYSGFAAVDRATIDAGRATGMTEWQILWKIEVPLGLPLLIAGLRSATLQTVATVTIAAYVNLGGLGLPILAGIQLRDIDRVLGGALLVTFLAFALDALFAILQAVAVPRGVRAGGRGPARSRRARRGARRTEGGDTAGPAASPVGDRAEDGAADARPADRASASG